MTLYEFLLIHYKPSRFHGRDGKEWGEPRHRGGSLPTHSLPLIPTFSPAPPTPTLNRLVTVSAVPGSCRAFWLAHL